MHDYKIDGSFITFADGTRVRVIAGGGDGSSKQTTTSTQTRAVATPTPAELAAQRMAEENLRAYNQQLAAIQTGQPYQLSQQISEAALQNILKRTQGGGSLVDPQTLALINQAYDYPQQRGMLDIRRAAEQEAQRRGMALTDTPIGNTWGQNLSDFGAQLASARAKSALDLGNQLYQNWAAAAPVGINLQQQLAQNTLAGQEQAAKFANQLASFRAETAPVTTTQVTRTKQPFSQTFGQLLGAAGQAAGGIAGLGGAVHRMVRPKDFAQAQDPLLAAYLQSINQNKPAQQTTPSVGFSPTPNVVGQYAPVTSWWNQGNY